MQSFVCFIAIAVLATVVSSASVGSTQQAAAPQNILEALTEESNLNAPSELTRWKKSAYGGGSSSSYPAPPCPKTYLFSCQPNVAPVPCAPAQSGYAGAYSAPVPTFTVPQELNRPIRSYNQNTL